MCYVHPDMWDRRVRAGRGRVNPKGFTLVELLVVAAIISLLLAMMLPSVRVSVRQARSTVCKSNLKDLYRSLDMYQTDNNGRYPIVPLEKSNTGTTWAQTLFLHQPAGKGALICPEDPWATVFRNTLNTPGADIGNSSSYGFNDFIASSPNACLANTAQYSPKHPADTMLLADMGPDQTVPTGGGSLGAGAGPQRNYGRLAVDDQYCAGSPQQVTPWLTGRHRDKINVLTVLGNIKEVDTNPALRRVIRDYYDYCANRGCSLCLDFEMAHYSFAESNAFWWTGRLTFP